ncbi:MAG TPA: hypothetical protein VMI12_05255 [Puia sp.]|nr:hypothetical protein [Puia sp.]
MNKVVFLLFIFFCQSGFSQSGQISKEEFLNEIFNQVADSNFSKFYLIHEASPCSFKRYDYGEWVKYGLKENITIDILNELAKKSYLDTSTNNWNQDGLTKAICIERKQASAILDSANDMERKEAVAKGKKKKIIREELNEWNKKPPEEKLVFYFSKPEFTDDLQYAVINVVYRCDDKACGMGATYLFSRTDHDWKVAGKMISWGN